MKSGNVKKTSCVNNLTAKPNEQHAPDGSGHKHPLVYLDHAAATPPVPEIINEHAGRCRQFFFNPHSTHHYSEQCQQQLANAERSLRNLLAAHEEQAQIIWTSGGTEANNLAILGALREMPPGLCLVDAAAHRSMLAPVERYAAECRNRNYRRIPVDRKGCLDFNNITAAEARNLRLVAVTHVNNETGAIQNLPAIRAWLDRHAPQALLAVDALQSFTKIDVPWNAAKIDLLTLGGRKIGGPPATGALIFRRGTPIQPLFFGGGQQNELRPGTVDTIGVLEFTRAATVAAQNKEHKHHFIAELNTHLRQQFQAWSEPKPVFISPPDASPYILTIAFPGYEGAVIMRILAERNIIVATGSACLAEHGGISHVLKAMNIPTRIARGTIRISLGHTTTAKDIQILLTELQTALANY